jgi:hypothetical protein
MEKRSLGMIVVAGVIALGAITTAYVAARAEPKQQPTATITVETQKPLPAQDINGNGIPDWQEAFNAGVSSASSTASYVAPASLPTTEALARELFASYADAKQGGTLDMDKINAAIEEAVTRQTDIASAPKAYTLAQLSVHADVPVVAYEGALMLALKDAEKVTEYELSTFERVIKGSKTDLARLKAAADVYAAIAEKLAVLQVPTALATNHLGALNSLSALSSATRDLSHWTGDPLDALVLVNNFVAADNAFAADLTNLFVSVRTLEKKS